MGLPRRRPIPAPSTWLPPTTLIGELECLT